MPALQCPSIAGGIEALLRTRAKCVLRRAASVVLVVVDTCVVKPCQNLHGQVRGGIRDTVYRNTATTAMKRQGLCRMEICGSCSGTGLQECSSQENAAPGNLTDAFYCVLS